MNSCHSMEIFIKIGNLIKFSQTAFKTGLLKLKTTSVWLNFRVKVLIKNFNCGGWSTSQRIKHLFKLSVTNFKHHCLPCCVWGLEVSFSLFFKIYYYICTTHNIFCNIFKNVFPMLIFLIFSSLEGHDYWTDLDVFLTTLEDICL